MDVIGGIVDTLAVTIANAASPANYRAIITNGGCVDTSTVSSLIVNPAATGGTTSNNGPLCDGETGTITLVGETGTIQWQTDTSGAYVDVVGATVDTLAVTIANAASPANYRAIITNGSCFDTSSSSALIVNPLLTPSVTMVSGANPICSGESASFSVTDSTNGGTDPIFAWSVNGVPAGGDTNTFSSATISDQDTVVVVMTSNETCLAQATNSDTVIMSVTGSVTPTLVIAADIDPSCVGDLVTVAVTDSTGGGGDPSYAWQLNGAPAGSDTFQFSSTAFNDGDSVSVVMTSNSTCATQPSDTAWVILTVNPVLIPNVQISGPDTICDGELAAYLVTDSTNSGVSPAFQWMINGSIVGIDSNRYETPSMANGDTVAVVMTSDTICAQPLTDTSFMVITVNPLLVPSVSIAGPDTICDGAVASFVVTDSTNGGASPSYTWFVNTLPVGIDSAGFETSTLTNSDSVKVVMSTSEVCFAQGTDTTTIAVTVQPNLVPSVTVTGPTTLCASDSGLYSVSDSTNGGLDPSYAWFVNGIGVAGDTNAVNLGLLTDQDTVVVAMITSESCFTTPTDADTIIVNVTTIDVPSVTVVESSNPICAGDSVEFEITDSTGGGSDPSFAWFVNGIPDGIDTNVYMNSALVDGDSVSVIMTSSSTCTSKASDSAFVIMTVNPLLTPSVIFAGDDTICAGAVANFAVNDSTNGGTDPTFAWFVNDSPVGSDSLRFSQGGLLDNDTVKVVMSSNEVCLAMSSDTFELIMNVNPNLTPQVIINGQSAICSGDTSLFTVVDSTNGGVDPIFAWTLNGAFLAGDTNAVDAGVLSDQDTVVVTMTSDVTCVTSVTASDSIIMSVTGLVSPSVAMNTSDQSICAGTNVEFTVSDSTGGGANPSFSWFVNSIPVGSDSSGYSDATLTDGDSVKVIMQSILSCANPITDTAFEVMTVFPLMTPAVSISGTDSICLGELATYSVTDSTNGGTDPTFEWLVNGSSVAGDTTAFSSSSLSQGDTIAVVMTSVEACASPLTDTASIIIKVTSPSDPFVSIAGPTNVILGLNASYVVDSLENEGNGPSYQWYQNAIPVGSDSAGYATSTLTDGDTVKVVMTSNQGCITRSTDTSFIVVSASVGLTNPDAVADTVVIPEDTIGVVIDLIANDTDFEDNIDSSSVTILDGPGFGTVVNHADGTITYKPDTNYFGNDTIVYQVCDLTALCDFDTVWITVTPVEDAPIAMQDNGVVTRFCEPISFTPLNNDVDAEENILPASLLLLSPFQTSATYSAVGGNVTVDYSTDSLFVGIDTVRYRICDATALCDTGLILINVLPNATPVTASDTISIYTAGDGSIDVLANDTDDGFFDSTSLRVLSSTFGGIVTADTMANVLFDYSSLSSKEGIDTIVYEVCDQRCLCASDTVFVTVADPPILIIANNDTTTTFEGCANLTFNVWANDELPPSFDSSAFSLILGADSIYYSIDHSGNITADYGGAVLTADTHNVTYQICSIENVCDQGDLVIIVSDHDEPIVTGENANGLQGELTIVDVLANDSDIQGLDVNQLTPISSSLGAGLSIVDGELHIDYSVVLDSIGLDTVVYEVCDNFCKCAQEKVLVFVSPDPDKLIIYEGFSPNGDGQNEVWEIEYIEMYPLNSVQIFNRWGNLIYQAKGYTGSPGSNVIWDGTSNTKGTLGKTLPDGTYYYILDLGIGPRFKKVSGFVVLHR